MNKKVFLYFHFKATTKEVFYVGIGIGKRAYRESGRSQLWNRYKDKFGLLVEIIEFFDTWEDAKIKEIFYIKQFGRIDKRTGILVNHTDGGDGSLGCVYNVGKKRSSEQRQKISTALKGRKINPEAVANSVVAKKINREKRKLEGIPRKKRRLGEGELERLQTVNIGRKLSDERKKSISEKLKGRIFSEETRRKNSEGVKRYWANKKQAA